MTEDITTALAEPEPEGPTDRELLAALKEAIIAFPPDHPAAQELSCVEYMTQLELRKARAILATWGSPAPQPIPVTERLPKAEGCDAGRCWWGAPALPGLAPASWRFVSSEDRFGSELYWLPANALPLPR